MTERHQNILERARAALGRTAGTQTDLLLRDVQHDLGETPPEWRPPEPARERAPRMNYKARERQMEMMSREAQARWDHWCDSRINPKVARAVEDLAAICGEGVAHFVGELRKEINALRSEVQTLRGIIDGDIAELKKTKRHG